MLGGPFEIILFWVRLRLAVALAVKHAHLYS